MAAINQYTRATSRVAAPVPTVMASGDTITFTRGTGQWLHLRNITGGSLSPVITGSAASSSFGVDGLKPVDTSTGFAVGAIAAAATRAIYLDDIWPYLQGTISITANVGMEAYVVGL
jgi:uncharacterized membrane protein YoaK (UPF0700 family)